MRRRVVFSLDKSFDSASQEQLTSQGMQSAMAKALQLSTIIVLPAGAVRYQMESPFESFGWLEQAKLVSIRLVLGKTDTIPGQPVVICEAYPKRDGKAFEKLSYAFNLVDGELNFYRRSGSATFQEPVD